MWSSTVPSLIALMLSSFFFSTGGADGSTFFALILSLPLPRFFPFLCFAILFYFSQHQGKQSFSHWNSVCCLLKICRMRRAVHAFVYFPDSWKRMHYLEVFFNVLQKCPVNFIDILEFFIFNRVREPFFLDSCDIQNIHLPAEPVQVARLEVLYFFLKQFVKIIFRNLKLVRGYEVKSRVEVRQCHHKRMNRPAVF